MHSLNRLIYLYFGSISVLFLILIWIAFAFEFTGLDNALIKLSESKFVGYNIPELLGADKGDVLGEQVLRLKLFFSILIFSYSIFSLWLFSIDEGIIRIRLLFVGISIPVLGAVVLFWLKFINENHIVDSIEKRELFLGTVVPLLFSIFLLFLSKRPSKRISNEKKNILHRKKNISGIRQAVKGDPLKNKEPNMIVQSSESKPVGESHLEELPPLEEILKPESAEVFTDPPKVENQNKSDDSIQSEVDEQPLETAEIEQSKQSSENSEDIEAEDVQKNSDMNEVDNEKT